MTFNYNDYVKYTYGKGKHLTHRQGRVTQTDVGGKQYAHILTDIGGDVGCCHVLVDNKNVYEIIR